MIKLSIDIHGGSELHRLSDIGDLFHLKQLLEESDTYEMNGHSDESKDLINTDVDSDGNVSNGIDAVARRRRRNAGGMRKNSKLSVNIRRISDGYTPLHCAAIKLKPECYVELLKHGADPLMKTAEGLSIYTLVFKNIERDSDIDEALKIIEITESFISQDLCNTSKIRSRSSYINSGFLSAMMICSKLKPFTVNKLIHFFIALGVNRQIGYEKAAEIGLVDVFTLLYSKSNPNNFSTPRKQTIQRENSASINTPASSSSSSFLESLFRSPITPQPVLRIPEVAYVSEDFYLALIYGKEDKIFKIINSRSIDINTPFGKSKSNALMLACANGHIGIAKLLIENGCDISYRNYDGSSVLSKFSTCNEDVVEILPLLVNGSSTPYIAKQDIFSALKFMLHTKSNPSLSLLNALITQLKLLSNHGGKNKILNLIEIVSSKLCNHESFYSVFRLLRQSIPETPLILEYDESLLKAFTTPLHVILSKSDFTSEPIHQVIFLLEEMKMKSYIDTPKVGTLETALHLASENGYVNVISLLLSHGANRFAVNHKGNTFIHAACMAPHNGYDIIKKSIENYFIIQSDKDKIINFANEKGETPLYLAAKYNQLDIFKYFVSLGADIKCISNNGSNILHAAFGSNCSSRNRMIVGKYLMESLPEETVLLWLNQKNEEGSTPLLYYCSKPGPDEDVIKLLEKGLDPLKNDTKCLDILMRNGNSNAINAVLLKQSVKESSSLWSIFGETGISNTISIDEEYANQIRFGSAVCANDVGLASKLLESRAIKDINIPLRSKGGYQWILFSGNGKKVGVVQGSSSQINDDEMFEKSSVNFLHMACFAGNAEMVSFLLEHGADSNSLILNQHLSPLHTALISPFSSRPQIVELLLKSGANHRMSLFEERAESISFITPHILSILVGAETATIDLLELHVKRDSERDGSCLFDLVFAKLFDNDVDEFFESLERLKAASPSNDKTLKYLFCHAGPSNMTLLHLACSKGLPVVKTLCESYKDCIDLAYAEPKTQTTNLIFAAKIGDLSIFKYLFEETLKVTSFEAILDCKNQAGENILHVAVDRDRSDIAHFIIDQLLKANKQRDYVDIQTRKGQTALHLGCCASIGSTSSKSSYNLIKRLITDCGANVNAVAEASELETCCTPLLGAVINKRSKIVELLLEQPNIDVNFKSRKDRLSALLAAVHIGYFPTIDLLVSKGKADMNTQEAGRFAVITHAAALGNYPVLNHLLINASSPGVKDDIKVMKQCLETALKPSTKNDALSENVQASRQSKKASLKTDYARAMMVYIIITNSPKGRVRDALQSVLKKHEENKSKGLKKYIKMVIKSIEDAKRNGNNESDSIYTPLVPAKAVFYAEDHRTVQDVNPSMFKRAMNLIFGE